MSNRLHTILVVLLLCMAGFFATFHLKESPPVWYDEGIFTQAASNLALTGHEGLRIAPDTIEPSSKLITVGYPLIYPLAGWFKTFGISLLSARSFMVVFILCFLIISYIAIRYLFGMEVALCSLALLATLPTLYGNGKTVLGEVPGLVYLSLFLVSFSAALSSTTKKNILLILAGLFAGLCAVTKPQFLMLLPALVIGIFLEWKRGILRVREIGIITCALVAPILFWIFTQFQTGDSFKDVFIFYANNYQITDTGGAVLHNIKNLFISLDPLYLLTVIFVWIAALWIRVRQGKTIVAVEIITFVFSVLLIGVYLSTAGWYRYLFGAQVASLLFFPNALFVVAENVVSSIHGRKMALAAIILLSVSGAYQVLFDSFVAESYHRQKTAYLETHFDAASPATSYFLYNVPEVGIFIHGTNYYQYINPGGDSVGVNQLTLIQEGKVDRVILGTDAYISTDKKLFARYSVSEKNHDYTILEKI